MPNVVRYLRTRLKIKSDEIRQRLLGVERVKQAKTICTFISAFKEPDTVEIIKELWEQDKNCCADNPILRAVRCRFRI